MITEFKKETEFLFQFLGINFNLDDIIIISILFILYSEKMQNTYIFITLAILLVS